MLRTLERSARLVDTARLVGLLASGVLSGGMVVVLVLDVELGRSAELYMRYRQATTGPLTVLLPPLGVTALLATGATLVLEGSWCRQPGPDSPWCACWPA